MPKFCNSLEGGPDTQILQNSKGRGLGWGDFGCPLKKSPSLSNVPNNNGILNNFNFSFRDHSENIIGRVYFAGGVGCPDL